MEIDYLKTFIAIAERGTFGAAGKMVGLTQSAVSQQIKSIEEQLGVKLFDRTVRPPGLTVQGLTFLEGARKIVSEYEVTARTIKGEKLSGNLLLGAIRTSFIGALPIALSNLKERYPQLRVNAHTLDTTEIISTVTAGRLDAGIIPHGIQLQDDISWKPFAVEPLVVISNTDTTGKTDRYILENFPFIKFSRKVLSAKLVDDEIRKRKIGVMIEMNIDSYAAILQMVSHGLGVSVVPDQARRADFPSNIHKTPFGNPPVKRVLGIIYQKETTKRDIISLLHSELCDLCGFTASSLP
jgi:DNA-binding transcriptional LysR family regulator